MLGLFKIFLLRAQVHEKSSLIQSGKWEKCPDFFSFRDLFENATNIVLLNNDNNNLAIARSLYLRADTSLAAPDKSFLFKGGTQIFRSTLKDSFQ